MTRPNIVQKGEHMRRIDGSIIIGFYLIPLKDAGVLKQSIKPVLYIVIVTVAQLLHLTTFSVMTDGSLTLFKYPRIQRN